MQDTRQRIDRKIFKRWTKGGYRGEMMMRCAVIQYAINRGETVVFTEDGIDFSCMRLNDDGVPQEFTLDKDS